MLEQLAHRDEVPWSLKHTILVDMGGIALRFLPPKDGDTPTSDQDTQKILPEGGEIPEFIKDFCRRQDRLLKRCGRIPWDLWECHVEHAFEMENRKNGESSQQESQQEPQQGLQAEPQAEPQAESPVESTLSEADVAALAGNIWILDSKQLAIARNRNIITKMPHITEEAIDDKSKSDGLVKIIAVLQVLWLVVQLVVRTIDNLHFTQLEITTVAFAATAVIIYSIDFIKPKDVNVPFYIDIRKVVKYDDFVAIAKAAPFAYIQGKRYYMPTSTLHDLIDYEDPDMSLESEDTDARDTNTRVTDARDTNTRDTNTRNTDTRDLGNVDPETTNPGNTDPEGSSQESSRLPNGSQRETRQGGNGEEEKGEKDDYRCYKDLKNKKLTCQFCFQWRNFIRKKRSKKSGCSWRKLYTLSPKSADIFSLLIGFASATSFGGVHLFAWNSDFPTDVERLLWRISALMTIVLPYIYIATHIPHVGDTVADIRKQKKTVMNIVLGCIAICYIPCRLFLVTESFRALYFLPSEAFKATPAVMSIPHLG
ncbi:uncharacterized protein Triagg1_10525 [Trichoderma aggressivum f. europaeum]|uniref:Uncharacterized protein n=1 Tax=Trichoderma aggressivum f. europaeum TaxID=173218 RepID=A0AAE1I5A7_9HYPO|nr:hypothetical protein Triagg1_10525 [Trichoderma aggressivum f. europaeum]